MEKSPPSCLNSAYFEKALRSSENDTSIIVTSCDLRKATAAGDNYSSDIYRATVKIERDGQPEERSIIIKCSLGGGAFSDFLKVTNIFDRETKMFTIAFPEIERLLRKAYGQEFQPIAAKYVYSHADELATTIALEDLKVQGFKLAERTLGLDMKHCLLVMNRVAKYHAASVVINHENPEIMEPFRESAASDQSMKDFEPFFTKYTRNCAKEVETWADYKDRFAEKLHRLSDVAMDEWVNAIKRKDNEYNVLIHGDFWANNMMFRYSEETRDVQDVRFVDFQISNWTSPAIDVQYFLNSSASPELLENPQVLIKEYCDTFNETLNLLGRPHLKPSPSEINEQMEKRSNFAVLSAVILRYFVLPDRSNVPDINKVFTADDKSHFSEEYKQALRKLLTIYERNGWI